MPPPLATLGLALSKEWGWGGKGQTLPVTVSLRLDQGTG